MKMLPQLLASAALLLWTSAVAQAPEPFPVLNGYSSDGNPPQPFSPDPLVRYTWSAATNQSQLQIYRVVPLATLNSTDALNIKIRAGPTTCLMIDWGVEYAGWLEFESPDLQHHSDTVSAAISEFNSPIPGKKRPLTKYKNTYRLETNKELYEGVRFTWIYYTGQEPWHISRLTLVAKVKPVNYTGAFAAFDSALTQAWYTGAYAVRLNMEADAFNSILVERGDRVAIQGDGHPTMAAALVAFAPYSLVKDMLVQTNSGDIHGHNVVDQNIMAYPLYWTMSVNDWFMASGNVAGFKSLAQDCMSIVQKRLDDFLENPDIVWMGWDDRIGNGWCFQNSCNREAHLAFAGLVVRACRDLARSLGLAGMVDDSRHFAETALRLFDKLRQVPEWPGGFGLHAAANAINTGLVVNPVEARRLFESALNDSVNICSWSPFNQYWILQALGNADKMDHAVASIKLCWGTMLTLGKGCFWEVFSPEWAAFLQDGDKAPTMPSYCHPWSSGVTAWLSHVLGGIQPLLPGYKEFVVAPHVSVRNPSVSTTVPTPFGPISVNATLDNRQNKRNVKVVISVKAAVRGFVGIPKDLAASLTCSIGNHSSLVNGKPSILRNASEILSVADGDYAALAEHFAPAREAALLFVRIASPGTHVVEVRYSGDCKSSRPHSTAKPTRKGIPHYRPFPPPRYAAATSLDRASHGDGIFKYGTDGYVLFGFDNGTDLVRLPDYIQNVTVHNHGFDGWTESPRTFIGSSRSDESFLPDPRRSRNDTRALGMVTEDLNNRGSQGIIIDVHVSERVSSKRSTSLYLDVEKANMTEVGLFSLSVYCVSQDRNKKHAIRAMDLETFNVVAPDGFVSDYENGVWWTMRHKKSVRLRVMSIYGVQVSAIAFAGEKDRSIPGAIS